MAYRVRPAALATVQDQRELGSGDLATRLCVGLIPKVDTQASLGCQAGLEKGVSDGSFWRRPGWASTCCPEDLDSELDAHCPRWTPDRGCPLPWCVCGTYQGLSPAPAWGEESASLDHQRLVLSLDKGCQSSPQGPPEVPLGTGLVPRSGPLPALSAPGLRVGTAAGVGEALQGDRVAVAWHPSSGGAWAGPRGAVGPCIPCAPVWGGRGGRLKSQ